MSNKNYTLVGVNGNAFCILGTVKKWMRMEGYSDEEIQQYDKEAKSSNYDHLLCVSIEMVEKLNEGKR